jgi:hypothetical protein
VWDYSLRAFVATLWGIRFVKYNLRHHVRDQLVVTNIAIFFFFLNLKRLFGSLNCEVPTIKRCVKQPQERALAFNKVQNSLKTKYVQ